MRTATIVLLVASLTATGCTIRLKTPSFPSATRPQGVTARLELEQTTFVGELLEVRNDAFLVLTPERTTAGPGLVRLIPRTAVRLFQIDAPNTPRGDPNGKAWNETALTTARLLSRFPHGLPPDLLQQLLQAFGQTVPAGIERVPNFVERAQAATVKYRNRDAAILDGYRRIGGDFPAMGEHWIRIGLVFDGTLDPARPEVLNYVMVDGRPTLAGLGYAMPLLKGELPPAAPAGRESWHDHFRSIEDETVVPHEHQHGPAHDGPRLAMLHVWTDAPNPDGVFAADNWALPFVRLGLETPVPMVPDAARAISLLTDGGVDYFERQGSHARAALLVARSRAETIVASRRGPVLTGEDIAALASAWPTRR